MGVWLTTPAVIDMQGFLLVTAWVSLLLVMLWGWVWNLLKILNIVLTGGDVTGSEMVTRVIGAILWPFGAIMGFF